MNTPKEWADYVFWRAATPEDLEGWIRQIQAATIQSCMRKVLDSLHSDTVRIRDAVDDCLEEAAEML